MLFIYFNYLRKYEIWDNYLSDVSYWNYFKF